MIIPDGTTLLDYMFERVDFILSGLLVHPENMLRSMAMSHNLVHAQRVMLALVEKGMLRETAYDLVQRLAMESWAKECDYKELLLADPEVSARLSAADLDALCRPENSYGHIDEIFERELG